MRVEMRQPGEDDPPDRPHHAEPQQLRQPRNRGNPPVKQESGQRADANRHQRSRHGDPCQLQSSYQRKSEVPRARRPDAFEAWPEESRILRQSNRPRSNRKRRAERELPDKEKRKEPPQPPPPLTPFH